VVTPVGVEQRAEALPGVSAAAATGVGPAGTQQLVVVVVPADAEPVRPGRVGRRSRTLGLAPAPYDVAQEVRRVAGHPVAAVLTARRLPLDVRHASKVDRAEVGRQAAQLLAGRGA